MPAYPEPMYGLDEKTQVHHVGKNSIKLLWYDPGKQDYEYVSMITTGYYILRSMDSHDSTLTEHLDDRSEISGYFEVLGHFQAGNYELQAVAYREDIDRYHV